jgi:hypothetical protein
VPLVEQELLTLPEHLRSPPVFSAVRVTRSLVLYVCFVDRCLSFCTLTFGHCVVCSSSIHGFWLPLWYLQTLLTSTVTSVLRKLRVHRSLQQRSSSNYSNMWGLVLYLQMTNTCFPTGEEVYTHNISLTLPFLLNYQTSKVTGDVYVC